MIKQLKKSSLRMNYSEKFSDFFKNFKKSNSFKIMLWGTFINWVILPFHHDLLHCLCRQCFILTYVAIHYNYLSFIDIFLKENNEITEFMVRKFPVLKVDFALLLLAFFSSVLTLLASSVSENLKPFIFVLLIILLILSLCFTCLKIFAILSISELKAFYDVPTSAKLGGYFSLYTFSKVLRILFVVFRIFMVFLLFSWLGPKVLLLDLDFRGVVWNHFTYHFSGYLSDSEKLCQKVEFLMSYEGKPILQKLICSQTGYIDAELVNLALEELKKKHND
jgi:hypothetical protein